MPSLHRLNWLDIGIDSILTNSNSEGVRYLQYFLKDYSELTGEFVNAGCHKCIAKYYNNYINLIFDMENDSKYRLHKKREGIPLAFGSNIRVTNRNITDVYAEKLIKRYQELKSDFDISDLFSKYPVQEVEVKETIAKPKQRRSRKSKK
jgi:hypothetical protein